MNSFIRNISTICLLIIVGCSSNIKQTVYPTLHDGKYDNEFPYKNCSDDLEQISRSIKQINTLAFYKMYVFDEQSKITKDNLNSYRIQTESISNANYTRSTSGTGTIIYSAIGKVALLTCAHVVSYPDTMFSYFLRPDGSPTNILESVSLKTEQSNYIAEFAEGGKVEILHSDEKRDLAIVGKKFKKIANSVGNVFKYPLGEAKSLEWGSFVYAFGFPLNNKVISKGLVSSPDKNGKGSFIIDAVFNQGFSGGIVLAIKDGVPNFELVGIIKSAPAEYEYFLKPSSNDPNFYFNPELPYKGQIYADERENIRYGLTTVIPVEEVLNFIDDCLEPLNEKGYDLSKLIEDN